MDWFSEGVKMGFFSFLGGRTDSQGSGLPEIYALGSKCTDFTKTDIISTYVKILTDTIERSHGLPKKFEPALWDNCVQSEADKGLISLLACAMFEQSELYLVYVDSVGVLRKATEDEEKQIDADYEKSGKSSVGIIVSFDGYKRTEILQIYSNFEYCVLASLNKGLNLSKAIQFKMNEMRASTALSDSEIVISQARSISQALGRGQDVMLDAKDIIDTAKPDTSQAEKAIGFLDAKKAFILGLPISYVSGLQTPGIGSTGEADMRAVERGLKQYFVSIIQPTIKALWGVQVEFKSQDFREINAALETLKTFELVGNDLISTEAKQEILRRQFGLDEKDEEKAMKLEAKDNAQNQKDQTQNQPPQIPNGDASKQTSKGTSSANAA
jgi:hypothetical protein